MEIPQLELSVTPISACATRGVVTGGCAEPRAGGLLVPWVRLLLEPPGCPGHPIHIPWRMEVGAGEKRGIGAHTLWGGH